MKIKKLILSLSLLMATSHLSTAATFLVSNVVNGPGDTLYADKNNSLLTSGFAAIGYFTSTIVESDINTISGLQSQLILGSFTTVAFADNFSQAENGIGDGYVDGTAGANNVGTITTGNPLLGRAIYLITTNQADLASFANGSGDDNQVALVYYGTILNDVPDVQLYSGNPAPPASIIIGDIGIYEETEGGYLGDGIYNTLTLAAVPEPSTLILSAFGIFGLLRRKR